MKNPIRESFAVGLSTRCVDAWWNQIEDIRAGAVPRKRDGQDPIHEHVKRKRTSNSILPSMLDSG